jgi:hypothetical protein
VQSTLLAAKFMATAFKQYQKKALCKLKRNNDSRVMGKSHF